MSFKISEGIKSPNKGKLFIDFWVFWLVLGDAILRDEERLNVLAATLTHSIHHATIGVQASQITKHTSQKPLIEHFKLQQESSFP